ASARVTVPASITQVACFAGPSGSNLPCSESTDSGDTATFSTGPLGAREALTVVVGFPTGAVPRPVPLLEERWSADRAFARTARTVGGASTLLAAVLGGFGWLVWRTGRDRRWAGSPTDVAFGPGPGDGDGPDQAVPLRDGHETPVEFVPPDGIRPGLVGTLIDEVAHPLDVSATIVDLAVRGYLRIEEVPEAGLFAKSDWTLHRQRDGEGLRRYEQLLLDGLFVSGDEVALSSLRNTFAARLAKVQDALYADVVDHGWFRKRPDTVRSHWTAIGVVALVASVALVVLAPPSPASASCPSRWCSAACCWWLGAGGCPGARRGGRERCGGCRASAASSTSPRPTGPASPSGPTCSRNTCPTPWSSGPPTAGPGPSPASTGSSPTPGGTCPRAPSPPSPSPTPWAPSPSPPRAR
ncbi:MAG: DUF2207 domain-containing protein, partial [Actinomycetota bacterium]|nr:DUF2207 domain-containing protein [Actinomycetota bacterium]